MEVASHASCLSAEEGWPQRILLLLILGDFSPVLEQLVDLVDEDGFGLGDLILDLHDLLADLFVNLLHVLKHLVHFFIERLQLVLVLLQLGLLLRDCGLVVCAREQGAVRELLVLALQFLVDFADRERLLVVRLNLCVVNHFVDSFYYFSSFFVHRLSDFLDVAGERT